MSEFDEYEVLKAEHNQIIRQGCLGVIIGVILILVGIVISNVVFFNLFRTFVADQVVLVGGIALIIGYLIRLGFKRRQLRARMSAVRSRNFLGDYGQEELSFRDHDVEDYASTPPNRMDGLEAELQRLNDLRASGTISEDEYAAFRAKLFQ